MLSIRFCEISKPISVFVEWTNSATGEIEKNIQFIVQHMGKKRQEQTDVFFHINRYWQSLSVDLQRRIYDLYEQTFNEFLSGNSRQQLENKLCKIATELLSYHKIENILYWAAHSCTIPVPSGVLDRFEKSVDKNTSREKTYTSNDYMQLAGMAIALKAMVPLWGEYSSRIKPETGDGFLDYFCFLLLKDSYIFSCEAMAKLEKYTEAMAGNDKNHPQIAMKSISSEDYVFHLVAGICFRRLALADVQFQEEKKMLVTLVYAYIVQKSMRGHDQYVDRNNLIKEKKPTAGEGKSRSVGEIYKAMTDLSLGEVVELNYVAKDPYDIARKICINVSDDLVSLFLECVTANLTCVQSSAHENMLRWVSARAISSNSHVYLSNENVIKLIAACSAVLWHAGHKYLALVLSAGHLNASDARYIPLADEDSKKAMTDDRYQRICDIYPFSSPIGKNKKSIKPVRSDNWTYKSIEEQIATLTGYVWRPTVPVEMYREVFGRSGRTIPIVNDIRDKFADLVIDVGSRRLQVI